MTRFSLQSLTSRICSKRSFANEVLLLHFGHLKFPQKCFNFLCLINPVKLSYFWKQYWHTFLSSFCDSFWVAPSCVRSSSAGNGFLRLERCFEKHSSMQLVRSLSQREPSLGVLPFFNSLPTSSSWETTLIVCSCKM